ncbi:putative aminotransferase class I and II family protein [Bisporella sp. PMI_857]|nr:putative aminotransferase class I and II family protein [Bisporella sp. PMI_857]
MFTTDLLTYHPHSINLGMADSSLMHKELVGHVNTYFSIDAVSHLTYGQGPNGSPRLLEALSAFFNRQLKPIQPIIESELIITSGVTQSIDALTWCICNEGEGILVGMPLYAGFQLDVEMRCRSRMLPVSFQEDNHQYSVDAVFDAQANIRAYERALKKYNEQQIPVRAVMISNPHNPLGRCYPIKTLQAIARFCQQHNLHLISDEIYANSTFKNASFPSAEPYRSFLSIELENLIDPKQLHVLYGMSKDFCANGLRLGVLQTRNIDLYEAVSSINIFAWPSYAIQDSWAKILNDVSFIENFIRTNQERLSQCYSTFASFLDQYQIPYIKGGNAGFFFWVHFVRLEGRPQLAQKVMVGMLKEKLISAALENKLYIRDGSNFFSEEEEDGWFRVTFTMDKKVLEVAIERLRRTLEDTNLLHPVKYVLVEKTLTTRARTE